MATMTPFPASSARIRPVRDQKSSSASQRRPAVGGSVTRSSSPVRLTRRGRIVLATFASVLLSVMVVLSGQITADAGSASGGPALATVVVQPGESLWSIASVVAPTADPRETIALIRDLNGMQGSTVVPGQSVVVPISS
jgi:LysM repeat protein